MEPKHHPDPSTILSYAAGSVTESFSLLIAAHIESCAKCRGEVTQAESLGADLLQVLPQVAMANSDLTQLWKSIDEPVMPEQPQHHRISSHGLSGVLSPFFPGGLQAVKWRSLVPGIQHHQLIDVESGSGSVRLLRIAQGVNIPDHTHLGSELTLILQGSYSDETGKFECGDLSDVDSSVQHRPFVDSDQPCICLIATDERLIFSSVLNRMIQPLIGI